MSDADPFFEFSATHLLMASVGAAVFVAYLLPRVRFLRAASSAAVLMILGLVSFAVIPGMPPVLDPTVSPRIWEMVAEFVVIVVLFATGLRIDNISSWHRWRPTVRLLLIAMPLTILAVALLGWALAGMTVAGAVLLGAVLSSSCPVMPGVTSTDRSHSVSNPSERLLRLDDPIRRSVSSMTTILAWT